jgi:hypothetical protein
MSGDWTITIAPLVGLAFNVLTQITMAHIIREQVGKSIVTGILAGFGVTLAVIFLGVVRVPSGNGEVLDAWLLGVVTYLALAFGFWVFINLNITSLRIRMLRQALRAGGNIAVADLLGLYSPAERLHRRLERLQRGGQLERVGDCWRLRSWQILLIARSIGALRMLVLPDSNYQQSRQWDWPAL